MSGTKLATSILILWLAGALLFVAFKPGGVKNDGKPLENPFDIVKYFSSQASALVSGGGSNGNTSDSGQSGGDSTT